MAKLVLIGLVEPKTEDLVEAFHEWYLGNHIEDTYNAPHITGVRSFKAVRDFAGPRPSGYITMYEVEIDDAEEAERLLGAYQQDPDAYPPREPNNGSMTIVGAAWYEEVVAFGPKA